MLQYTIKNNTSVIEKVVVAKTGTFLMLQKSVVDVQQRHVITFVDGELNFSPILIKKILKINFCQ